MKRFVLLLVGITLAFAIAVIALEWTGPVFWQNLKLRHYSTVGSLFTGDELAEVEEEIKEKARVDPSLLLAGGVARDGIPSIDRPRFDHVAATPYTAEELGLGLVLNGEARFYPYKILNWHEIVNDTVGGRKVAVTYCPLCETGIIFDRGETTFGVSGKLFQSCLVMYDRADETLYAQPWGLGILGPGVNESLPRYPVVRTTLGAWQGVHPATLVLSPETGYDRDYRQYPYGSYSTDRNIIFPVHNQEELTVHPKAIYQYYWRADDRTPANRFSGTFHKIALTEAEEKKDVAFGDGIRAVWDDRLAGVRFLDAEGRELPSSAAFAFVLVAMF